MFRGDRGSVLGIRGLVAIVPIERWFHRIPVDLFVMVCRRYHRLRHTVPVFERVLHRCLGVYDHFVERPKARFLALGIHPCLGRGF